MPDWDFDMNSRQATLWFKRGAPVDHTATVNGNTVSYALGGDIISAQIPNPAGTVNLAGLTLTEADKAATRQLLTHRNVKQGGI